MNNTTIKKEEIRKWTHEELEPYFQGEYGTMDTMLEMFDEQLEEKMDSLIATAREEVIQQLCIIRDTELSDTPMEKSRAAYNINVLIHELSQQSPSVEREEEYECRCHCSRGPTCKEHLVRFCIHCTPEKGNDE